MERRRFTREFKLEAVKLIKERYVQAARDLGVCNRGKSSINSVEFVTSNDFVMRCLLSIGQEKGPTRS